MRAAPDAYLEYSHGIRPNLGQFRPMVITGRVMKGFVWVDPKRCDSRALARWLALAEHYAGELPPKEKR